MLGGRCFQKGPNNYEERAPNEAIFMVKTFKKSPKWQRNIFQSHCVFEQLEEFIWVTIFLIIRIQPPPHPLTIKPRSAPCTVMFMIISCLDEIDKKREEEYKKHEMRREIEHRKAMEHLKPEERAQKEREWQAQRNKLKEHPRFIFCSFKSELFLISGCVRRKRSFISLNHPAFKKSTQKQGRI